jgi:4'-phosphopantetheinyl transferase
VNADLFANDGRAWPLRDGVVHVWRFSLAGTANEEALSDDERAIATRFVTRELRDRYVVAHAGVRELLAQYVDAPLVFSRGERGKPRVAGIEHNLSHCDDLALLAVAWDRGLGVDIERRDADIDHRAVGRLVRAPDEDELDFMRVWCRKEAALKATGVGLIDDLTSVSVVDDRVRVGDEDVWVYDLDLGGEHAGALATTRQFVKSRISCVERSAVIATSVVR